MALTIAESEAEGWTRDALTESWELGNKGMQPHKFTQHFHLTDAKLQQWWPLVDVQEFCLKLCAIYATVEIAFERQLAEYLWTKWFRKGKPCRFGNFFARYVGSYKPESPKTVPELLEAHRRICAQVLLRQVTLSTKDLDPMRPMTVLDRVQHSYENHENYRLEAIFQAIFVIMDTLPPFNSIHNRDPRDREFAAATSVILVRTGIFHDLRTGPINFAPIDAVSEVVDGNMDLRRIALGDAVDFILDLHNQNSDDPRQYV
ncbi:MAG: hypothetical protein Q9201_001336 [Fulgogasparrea decipioides]